MADKQETSADIIAEMRGARTEFPFVYLIGEPDTPEVIDFKTKEIIEPRKINIRRVTVKELADRLEAANKRERGDCAKLREALEKCANWGEQIDCQLGSSDETVYAFRDERCLAHNISECARAALAAPPRNCDVGTAEEQSERMAEFCKRQYAKVNDGSHICSKCRLRKLIKTKCPFAWAQMPYTSKEGGAE